MKWVRHNDKAVFHRLLQRNKDALEGYDESDVDSVVLDLGDPCLLIEQAYIALKPSGVMSIFVPTYNQVERVYHELLKYPFIEIKAIELIEREIQLKDKAIRPKTWMMVGHTGFLIFARKLQTDKESVKHSQKEEIGENESS